MEIFDYKRHEPIVSRAIAGDSEAFSELYRLTWRRQYVIVKKYFNSDILAEDILQDIYVKLLQSISTLKNPKTFMAFLNRITYNTCISYYRKKEPQNEQHCSDDTLFLNQPEMDLVFIPEEKALRDERYSALAEAMKTLSADERFLLSMRYYQNNKLSEIAEIMNCSLSTVKRRLNTAQKTLHQYFSQRGLYSFQIGLLPAMLKLSESALPEMLPFLSALPEATVQPPAKNISSKKRGIWWIPAVFAAVIGLILGVSSLNPENTGSIEDTEPPVLSGYSSSDKELTFTLKDDQSGVNPDSVYGLDADGNQYFPAHKSGSTFVFEIPDKNLTLFSSDFAGNQSSAALTISE